MLRQLGTILCCFLMFFSVTATNTARSRQLATDSGVQPGKRTISEKDLLDFVWVTDPQVSPDGSRLAYTKVVVNQDRSGYDTSIWSVSTAGNESPVQMMNSKNDQQPRWSPDGRFLAFNRGAQLTILSVADGETWAVANLPGGSSSQAWSPDGKHIAFTSSSPDEESSNNKSNQSNGATEHKSDAQVITRALFRSGGRGYVDPHRHSHIWVVNNPTDRSALSKPIQLTGGVLDEREHNWSPDSSAIYFLTTPVAEPYYDPPTTDLSSVSLDGSKPVKIATIPMSIFNLAISPDGSKAAFHGQEVTQPIPSYAQFNLWEMDLKLRTKPRNIIADQDLSTATVVTGDNEAPRGQSLRRIRWSSDGRWLFDIITKEGRTSLNRINAESGVVEPVTKGDQAVLNYSLSRDNSTIIGLISNPTMISDMFAVMPDGTERRLTDANQQLWSQLNLTPPEEIRYKSFDGRLIQGWIQKPPDFDPNKKYPLVLDIHGGPHGAFGWTFTLEFQWLAARGYVVLYVNPRGSLGYGQEFGNIIQYDFPGNDYQDLMAGVDEVVKRGYIDPKKLAITGGSAGGELTDWTVSHTDRFAAAVSARDIANEATQWYTASFPWFQPVLFKVPPFMDPQAYAKKSSITFVENIHTPMMFILGEDDHIAPSYAGGEQLFRALKYLKRPTVMIIFPREGHGLHAAGEPWHRVERLQHIIGWFDKWIMGVSHPEYEN